MGHWLANVQLAGFAPAFTLSQGSSVNENSDI